ncbi:RTX-I toxin determinant A from serotypes 1/9 [Variibacter gotjawalensis]|uniref:RTX-I toxin determinant A from serotypes 1/9 n=1 Tax=Variibacter gotjawalensis TaxID=1333996 RepID=A0A0S3PR84_9BRAD|nr:calcium-binding protein [Variibacter gotjawalensis]NIK48689.1 Ca2+-binding RTX toxin-like protein [Variibacter gotjawalensis]RZS50550.1 hypothetical protein EV661_3016 [Variibacter gotjawalensis]BAT58384.1 RTX-I toxin determinant A from serotypes 1/9 [Variibacter gotjawalensis]
MAKIAMSTVSMSATKVAVETAPTYKMAAAPTKIMPVETTIDTGKLAAVPSITKVAAEPMVSPKYEMTTSFDFTNKVAPRLMDSDHWDDANLPEIEIGRPGITDNTWTDQRDELEGGSGKDGLFGGKGDDKLEGHGGDDYLWGGLGKDSLYGGEDNDTLYGGDGYDDLHGDGGHDILIAGSNNGGYDGVDQLKWGQADYMDGGLGNDIFIINGDNGTVLTDGNRGGVNGSYIADGGQGHDRFNVQGGEFVYLTGGYGMDNFTFQGSFHGTAWITDFRGREGGTMNGEYDNFHDRICILDRDGVYDSRDDWSIKDVTNYHGSGTDGALIMLDGGGEIYVQGVSKAQMTADTDWIY